ncbi:MAG: type II secretion system protein, partial [Planctomycetes bacterium]|nr:type II secretion system protein [Planctomycetota bacterium]
HSEHGAARRGFTLVELVTVMGILAILVALVVGAFKGVGSRVAREGTIQMMAALDAGLRAYYDDWGKFPWTNESVPNSVAHLMGTVDEAAGTGYVPVPFAKAGVVDNMREAMLYAALNMRQRHGPYMASGAGQVAVKLYQTYSYRVYVDGWGRPIQYWLPEVDAPAPLLMSEGARQDFEADADTKKDNIYSYERKNP